MSAHSDVVYLRHILDAIEQIQVYTQSLTKAEFMASVMVQDAVVRQFQIIGEAAKKVSQIFRSEHPEIPWSSMAKMRDLLIHHYWNVDFNMIWDAVRLDLPPLLAPLKEVLTRG